MTPELGEVSATPVGLDNWYIFWQRAPEPGVIEIIQVHPLSL